jgi:5-methylcytosine-specific restriction endonuclease McrA
MDYKRCNACGLSKPVSEFYIQIDKRYDAKYYHSVCKKCDNLKAKEYYKIHRLEITEKNAIYQLNHKSEKREYDRQYHQKHARKHQERARKWYAEHPEYCREYGLKYRAKHPEQCKEQGHKWKREHPKQRSEYSRKYAQTPEGKISKANTQHKRRSQKKDGKITLAEWNTIKKQQHFRCYWCKVKFKDEELIMDHVIPLSKGGLHDASNIVASCQSCNSSKHDKIWSLI